MAPAPRAEDEDPDGEMDVFEFGELLGDVDVLKSWEPEAVLLSRLDEVEDLIALLESDEDDVET